MSTSKRLRLSEIAEHLGLDTSTVSRALRGDTSRVSGATIARVRAAAAEMGYTSNPIASALRGGKSRTLGVLVPTLVDTVMAQLCEGIQLEAYEHGYLALIGSTFGDQALRSQLIESHLTRRVDAMLLADSLSGTQLPEALTQGGDAPPTLMVLRSTGELPSVTADDLGGGASVAEHLLDLGHSSFILLTADQRIPSIENRVTGFLGAVQDAGIPRERVKLVRCGVQIEDGYEAMRRLYETEQSATAVFCVNDHSAVGAMRVLDERGYRIGQDIAVVGYGDDPLSARIHTPLTTVRTDMQLLGRRAVQFSFQMINGDETPDSVVTPTQLVVRESSVGTAPRS